jgi:hypothetical protein
VVEAIVWRIGHEGFVQATWSNYIMSRTWTKDPIPFENLYIGLLHAVILLSKVHLKTENHSSKNGLNLHFLESPEKSHRVFFLSKKLLRKPETSIMSGPFRGLSCTPTPLPPPTTFYIFSPASIGPGLSGPWHKYKY